MKYHMSMIENLGKRKGEMRQMVQSQGNTRLEFLVPSRGLIGFRSEFMTQTKGTGIMHHIFHGYEPFKGELSHRTRGALIVMEDGDPEEASVVRFWCTRQQAGGLAAWSSEVVQRGRPICPQCGQPMEPEGHFCPKKNGHKH